MTDSELKSHACWLAFDAAKLAAALETGSLRKADGELMHVRDRLNRLEAEIARRTEQEAA